MAIGQRFVLIFCWIIYLETIFVVVIIIDPIGQYNE